jgi:predicted tellurium resistance membrane protein TerC
VIIMTTFAVPEEHQHKVLTFGIVLALIMRAIFIASAPRCCRCSRSCSCCSGCC